MLILTLTPVALCQEPNGREVQREWMVIVPHAVHIQRHKLDSGVQLTYQIRASYPAQNVLHTINTRLHALGWKPLRDDFLNPGLPSSHVRGWLYYEDHATQPYTSVRVWQADWQDAEQEVVTYRLEYRCAENECSSTANLVDLQVVGLHVPAGKAEQLRRQMTTR